MRKTIRPLFGTALPMVKDDFDGPLYRNLYASIRSAILNGTMQGGTRLPSSRALATEFGISRMTVVNAYEQLMSEGYLESRAGSGTFVADALPEHYLHTQEPTNRENIAKTPRRSLSPSGTFLKKRTTAILLNESETGFLPFQHGLASLDDFPYPVWQRIVARTARISLRKLLSECGPLGYEPLREHVAAHLRGSRAVNCTANEIVIMNGAQQALDLCARLFLTPGDVVWMDEPGYRGAREAFGLAGAKVLPVRSDANGFDLDFAVRKHPPAKLIYTTPSHQFPVGGAMSIGRRLELLEWADANDALIVEDDYDSEFRYAGRPLASMQGLDRNGRVIYVGTFSKTIFSALRMGCMVVPPDLVELLQTSRAVIDGHSSLMDQAVLGEFIGDGHFARHLRRMRKLYAERQSTFLRLASKYLPAIEFEPAASGMHLIGWLPAGVSDIEFSTAAAERGVRIAPLTDYAVNRLNRSGVLFGYAGFNERQMTAALKKVSDISVG